MAFEAASSSDPTGILSAAGAAVGLVGGILTVVPAIQNQLGGSNAANSPGGPPRAAVPFNPRIDPERERRAYETLNYVLREIGSRLCEAGLVDLQALSRALVSATKHIEYRLFSVEANRLFESLGAKLSDAILVNNIFTSIYFIGALTAELSSSLPNYKETYLSLGPCIIQQLMRVAIGEDAFRDNLTANLEAYKVLAATAGLLRPTDIGYSAFPGFPSFSPCRYSSKNFGDGWSRTSLYERMIKQFSKVGFPQPIASRRAEVGYIRDWRFLTGDSNSTTFEVEKTDKHIGENFGRVLHWLVCSADRMPPGTAVIAYHDQHIELIGWIGERMGYTILRAGIELEITNAHIEIDKKAHATISSWLIIMPSGKAQALKRANALKWNESQKPAVQAQKVSTVNASPQPRPTGSVPMSPSSPQTPAAASLPVGPSAQSVQATTPQAVAQVMPAVSTPVTTPSDLQITRENLVALDRYFTDDLLLQHQRNSANPPTDANAREYERQRLLQTIEKEVIFKADAIRIDNDEALRQQRQNLILRAQQVLDQLESANPKTPRGSMAELSGAASPADQTPYTARPQNSRISSVSSNSYVSLSPTSSPSIISTATPASTAPTGRTFSVVKRKAPPPPRKFPVVKALYDFEPDEDNPEELAFKEGNDIEIIEKTAALEEEGWCRIRIKGTARVGLAPLEYLEEVKVAPTAASQPASRPQTVGSPAVPGTPSTTGGSNPVVSTVGQETASSRPTQVQGAQPSKDQPQVRAQPSASNAQTAAPRSKAAMMGTAGTVLMGVGGIASGVAALTGSGQRGNASENDANQHSQTEPPPPANETIIIESGQDPVGSTAVAQSTTNETIYTAEPAGSSDVAPVTDPVVYSDPYYPAESTAVAPVDPQYATETSVIAGTGDTGNQSAAAVDIQDPTASTSPFASIAPAAPQDPATDCVDPAAASPFAGLAAAPTSAPAAEDPLAYQPTTAEEVAVSEEYLAADYSYEAMGDYDAISGLI
ncbi:MAG: hypothetical protein M1825_001937 [Sarcosagium campestre]|nr:MAG: hypothetical protein M1825_001937 [Sarcosagium campestre]